MKCTPLNGVQVLIGFYTLLGMFEKLIDKWDKELVSTLSFESLKVSSYLAEILSSRAWRPSDSVSC
jgi:hypothetical protein